ncbi:hypothetical protein B0H19DRAFT_1311248 [Mycena capillaripes]|nr:hypothetical protein B0H19DRAFT_1311248 [Mycena capillaripes]
MSDPGGYACTYISTDLDFILAHSGSSWENNIRYKRTRKLGPTIRQKAWESWPTTWKSGAERAVSHVFHAQAGEELLEEPIVQVPTGGVRSKTNRFEVGTRERRRMEQERGRETYQADPWQRVWAPRIAFNGGAKRWRRTGDTQASCGPDVFGNRSCRPAAVEEGPVGNMAVDVIQPDKLYRLRNPNVVLPLQVPELAAQTECCASFVARLGPRPRRTMATRRYQHCALALLYQEPAFGGSYAVRGRATQTCWLGTHRSAAMGNFVHSPRFSHLTCLSLALIWSYTRPRLLILTPSSHKALDYTATLATLGDSRIPFSLPLALQQPLACGIIIPAYPTN